MVTSRIGLVATATTTYNEPYNIARRFASIDHISGGRAGWNLVTSQIEDESENFGFDEHLAHAERYERAAEFYEVVTGLWDSWEDDGLLRDKATGVYMDRDKVHFLDHVGKHFKVKGPLNITRSPQGWPVVAQAGSSEAGRELAARTADVVFTAQTRIDEAKAFYADVKARAARYGRGPDDIKIMPGLTPVLGRTMQEAQRHLRIPAVADARRRSSAVAVAYLGRARSQQVPARRAAARACRPATPPRRARPSWCARRARAT